MLICWGQSSPAPSSYIPPADAAKSSPEQLLPSQAPPCKALSAFKPFSSTGPGQRPANMSSDVLASDVPRAGSRRECVRGRRSRCESVSAVQQQCPSHQRQMSRQSSVEPSSHSRWAAVYIHKVVENGMPKELDQVLFDSSFLVIDSVIDGNVIHAHSNGSTARPLP